MAMRLPLLFPAACVLAFPAAAAESSPDFAKDVRPVLSRYCFKCHGPDEEGRKGHLRLDDRTSAMEPAKSGARAVVPGNPGESELLKRILTDDPDEVMPPPSARQELSAAHKATLREWIKSGAEYKEHWAYTAPQRPPVPAAVPAAPHPVDAFIREKLAAAGLPVSPPAAPATLLRRVALDLTGLPPEPGELAALTAQAAAQPGQWEAIYAGYVDRLLASPQYGERWARKWLDLARYADTNGYEKDRTRPIWPWRDWVVGALNEDMPFDQFTIEQIAGDMLPNPTPQQIVATGFHRNTMLNEEGGIDPLEFRFRAVTDRVSTTGATWLGLTLQCAQCHTHKYDPIPHREYYSLMAFLNNSDEPDYPLRPATAGAAEQERQARREKLIAALPDQWPAGAVQWTAVKPSEVSAPGESPQILEDGSILFQAPGPDTAETGVQFATTLPEVRYLRVEALTDASLPSQGPGRTPHGNFVLSELTVRTLEDGKPVDRVIGSAAAGVEQSGYPVSAAYDGRTGTGWAVDVQGGKLNEPKSAVFRFAEPVRLRGASTVFMVTLSQQQGGHHTMGRMRFSLGQDAAGEAAPRRAADQAFAAWLQKERAAVVPWQPLHPEQAVSNSPALTIQPDHSVLASGDITKSDTYDLTFRTETRAITAIRLEALPHPSLPANGPGMAYYEGPKGDFFMGEFQVSAGDQPVRFASATDSYAKNGFGGNAGAARAFDGDAQTGWSTSGGEGRAHEAVFVLEKPLTPPGGKLSLRMLFGRHYACPLGRFRISVTTVPGAAASAQDGDIQELLARPEAALTAPERETLRRAFLLSAPELAGARREIDELARPEPYQTTLVMRERPADHPRVTRVHHRGEYVQPGETVEPAVLSMLNPLPEGAPRNRLSFARWLVSRDNPLTARVVVNRHWAALFGRGIVRTQEDFGFQGDQPTHPGLLDWLAVEFMESGWSVKKLHRLLVMSETYRQSSRVAGPGAEKDSGNLLLWRGPRFRLEAEQIRDAALAVTGLLSKKMGGPGVFPPQPAGVTTEGTYGGFAWTPPVGEDRYRRSLYTFAKRTAPFAMSNTFDAPAGDACVVRRDVSNTPLQSLTLLNDVMFMEAAQAMGKQLAAQPGTTEEKLQGLVLRVFGRPAADEEIRTLAAYVGAQQARFAAGELDPGKTGGAGADAAAGAWTLTVRALLNTDEFVTRS